MHLWKGAKRFGQGPPSPSFGQNPKEQQFFFSGYRPSVSSAPNPGFGFGTLFGISLLGWNLGLESKIGTILGPKLGLSLQTFYFYIFIQRPQRDTKLYILSRSIIFQSGTEKYWLLFLVHCSKVAQLIFINGLARRFRFQSCELELLDLIMARCLRPVPGFSEVSFSILVLNIWSFITVMWVEPGIVKWHPMGVTSASPC